MNDFAFGFCFGDRRDVSVRFPTLRPVATGAAGVVVTGGEGRNMRPLPMEHLALP